MSGGQKLTGENRGQASRAPSAGDPEAGEAGAGPTVKAGKVRETGRIPWHWDPAQFLRIGPIGLAWRYMIRAWHRRRSGHPRAHWLNRPSKELPPGELAGRAVLFDSWLLLDLRRGTPDAARLFEAAGERFISAISYMDMLAAATTFNEITIIQAFLQECGVEVLPISGTISRLAEFYLEYYGYCYGMSPRSALIAATAREHDLVLVSKLSEFRPLPQLKMVGYPKECW